MCDYEESTRNSRIVRVSSDHDVTRKFIDAEPEQSKKPMADQACSSAAPLHAYYRLSTIFNLLEQLEQVAALEA